MHYNKGLRDIRGCLADLSISYIDKGKELIMRCPYGCDENKRPGHFYMNSDSGVFICFKCGKTGNFFRFLADTGNSDVIGRNRVYAISNKTSRRSVYDKR